MRPQMLLPAGNIDELIRKYVQHTGKVLSAISIGNGNDVDESRNLDCAFVAGVTNAVIDTETAFAHNLGRVPVGFLVFSLNKAGVIYNSGTAFTSTNIYLKCNVVSVTFKIIVF